MIEWSWHMNTAKRERDAAAPKEEQFIELCISSVWDLQTGPQLFLSSSFLSALQGPWLAVSCHISSMNFELTMVDQVEKKLHSCNCQKTEIAFPRCWQRVLYTVNSDFHPFIHWWHSSRGSLGFGVLPKDTVTPMVEPLTLWKVDDTLNLGATVTPTGILHI